MNESQAAARLDDLLQETAFYTIKCTDRVVYFEINEPSIAQVYQEYVNGKISVTDFYGKAISEIMAAHSPLGKLL